MPSRTNQVTVSQSVRGIPQWKASATGPTELQPPPDSERVGDRYEIFEEISAGGMGSVYFGRVLGAAGFSRMVAIKRLHRQFAHDAAFISRFKDEARIAARVHHANIVQMLDVIECEDELLLVLEYLHGETLQTIQTDAGAANLPMPVAIVGAILVQALHGLHAAHETTDDDGVPSRIVHRDVSPQNILVGPDGGTKVLDFGIARAARQLHVTLHGTMIGKPAFMSPEQVEGGSVDRQSDIFSAGIVLWEALTAQQLFCGGHTSERQVLNNVMKLPIPPPSSLRAELSAEVDAVVLRALQRDPAERFSTAMDFARALEAAIPLASPGAMSSWLGRVSGHRFAQRAHSLAKARRVEPTALDTGSSHIRVSAGQQPIDRRCEPAEPAPSRRPAASRRRLFVGSALVSVGVLSLLWRAETSGQEAKQVAPGRQSAAMTPTAGSHSAGHVKLHVPAPSSMPLPETSAPVRPPAPKMRASPRSSNVASTSSRVVEPTRPTLLDCTDPTYLDATGIRHFKQGCF